MDQILLPVASLHTAKPALEYVMTRNRRERSWIHLLNVQRSIMAGEVTHFYTAEMITSARQAAGAEVLHPVRALLGAEGIGCTAQIVLGETAETIARYATERGCTGIVMGTRGMGAIGTFVLGSVATKVVNLTDIPVTLIKQPRETSIAALLRSSVREQYHARRQQRIETQDMIQGP
jgi:nucleotide-binding universal stress UspA family protein